jgi:hypothetical protein
MEEIKYRLFPHQLKLMNSKSPITYMVCGRAAGKSYAASLLVVKNFLEGKNVIALAQSRQSLKDVLFTEIMERLNELGVNVHYNQQSMRITYGNAIIYGGSYESLEAIRGLTRISLAVCDEAALSPPKLFATLSPCLRGEGIKGYIRLLSTPRKGSWLNLYCKEHSELIELIHATTRDNTFITEDQIKLMTSSIVNADLIEQELEGVMLDIDSEASVVKLSDYPKSKQDYSEANCYIGVDLAGLGCDYNVITVLNKYEIIKQELIEVANTFQLTNIIEELSNTYKAKGIFIDVTGSTSCGVYDMLKAKNYNAIPINFAQTAYDKDRYCNARCEMYVELSNAIKGGLFIDDSDIKTQLSFTTIFVNNSGKFQLCKKEEIKELIGHSPDKADSLALAVYCMNHIDQTVVYETKKAQEVASRYLSYFNRYN